MQVRVSLKSGVNLVTYHRRASSATVSQDTCSSNALFDIENSIAVLLIKNQN